MKYPFILMFVSVVLSTLLFAWILRALIVEGQILLTRERLQRVPKRNRLR